MAPSAVDQSPTTTEDVHTILLVEDEALIRLELADYLRGCGYKVVEAANAEEAMNILQSETQVDLVFTDVQMPGAIDGFGLTRWVRQHRSAIKVILTSGIVKSAEIAVELCKDGPMMDKPYDLGQVVQRIRTLLASGATPAPSR
jgi:CheY-like chemotaxis protein